MQKKSTILFITVCTTISLYAQEWKTTFSKSLENVSITYGNDDKYKGQLSNGSLEGMGIYYWSSGIYYFGNWSNGQLNGYGIYLVPEGAFSTDCQVYVGNFSNGSVSGSGACYDSQGNLIFYGNFSNGKPTETYPNPSSTFRTIESSDGNKYIGETKDGAANGYGIYIWENGDLWFGGWENGVIKRGIHLFYNADIYESKQNIQNTIHIEFNPAYTQLFTPQITRFRWSFAPGYAYRLGKVPESGYAQFDRLLKRLKNGFLWETEIQYYFSRKSGIAINISGVHSSVQGSNVLIPEYGQAERYEQKQQTTYIGPAWVARSETNRSLFYSSISLGSLFYTETQILDNIQKKTTASAFGINYSLGGEYKLSPNWAMGLKIGYTFGAAFNFKTGGQTFKTEEP